MLGSSLSADAAVAKFYGIVTNSTSCELAYRALSLTTFQHYKRGFHQIPGSQKVSRIMGNGLTSPLLV